MQSGSLEFDNAPHWWPGGHRAALSVTFDVDGPYGERNYQPASNVLAISQTEYEPFGLDLILGILADADALATFCRVGQEALDRPHLVKTAADQGHEISAHTWDHRSHTTMTADEQCADMSRTADLLHEMTGARPFGLNTGSWRYIPDTAAGCQQVGMRWAMDIPFGDLPYIMQPDPERDPLVQIPPSTQRDDYTFFVDNMMTPAEAFEFWRDELDVIRSEGLLMSLTMHPFVSGSPAASRGLVRLHDYAIELGDIWITRADHIANWWLEQNDPHSGN